jgi:hypothetical protein
MRSRSSKAGQTAKILINHIGYEESAAKKAVLALGALRGAGLFSLVRQPGGKAVYEGAVNTPTGVDHWRCGEFALLDFSDCRAPGRYRLRVRHTLGTLLSAPFVIERRLLWRRTLPALLDYFRGQRCEGVLDAADRELPFHGVRTERVDVHGGWYDAAGDRGKYLSHLCYANFMNPQQTPLVVWSLLAARELAAGGAADNAARAALAAEAVHGADFLVRMQDAAGYFYVTVFDRWSGDPKQRSICVFSGQEGVKSDDYQAGYRQGGGMAIAALARASAAGLAGEFSAARYLDAAVRGFEHLEKHNLRYLDDRRENIIDDTCALLAAAELYRLEGEARFLTAARRRASALCGRLADLDPGSPGAGPAWLRADAGKRPFYHASDAGLPALAFCRYLETEPEARRREPVRTALERVLRFELTATGEVSNPFGLARQRVKAVGGPVRHAFFIPHTNETGYWWQGENARLASLATAARLGARLIPADPNLCRRLQDYASDQLNWILGLNPFDVCMLHGFGANNPEYEPRHPNAFGGICNGITAGFEDENGLDFLPSPYAEQGEHRWRWSEQWLPHAAWYLLAVAAGPVPEEE